MNPFAYEAPTGASATLTSVAKGTLLVAASIASMSGKLILPLILAAAGLALHFSLRLSVKASISAFAYIAWISIFSAILRGALPGDGRAFALESLGPSAAYALRLFTVFLYARLYYSTTPAAGLGGQLTLGIRKLSRASKKNTDRSIMSDPGMLLSLSMLFLPRVFDTYVKVREALVLRARAGARIRFRHLSPLLFTLIFMSVKSALRTARAMELRGYSPHRTIEAPKFGAWDGALVAMSAILLVTAGL